MENVIDIGQTEQTVKRLDLNNGALWYVCVAPVFGLFLERYAASYTVGVALWIGCVISMLTAELIDLHLLSKCGYDTSKLKLWIWLFPIYVMKRERLCGHDLLKCALCAFVCLMALVLNGFVRSISIDGDYLTVSVQNTGVGSLDNFTGSSAKVIGECVTDYLGDDAQWSNEKTADTVWEITAAGEHEGVKYEVVFSVGYDGYAYQSLSLERLIKDGEELHDDDFSDLARIIFIDGKDSSSDSEAESSDSDE
ncbi:MAG: hypothetical protein IJ571_02030 [Ruminococcus sp.]|nr:hypothetical protein [Ruminococcus sp.]